MMPPIPRFRYLSVMLAGMSPEQRSDALTEFGRLGYRLVQVDQGIAYLELPE